ncbi:MAG TPA: M24 family metallopeptidase [Kofleriaceae bacterium]
MNKLIAIAIMSFVAVAHAQPAEKPPTGPVEPVAPTPAPKKAPAKKAPKKAPKDTAKDAAAGPVDPYADPAPTDPYADPAKPDPKAKGKADPKAKVDPKAKTDPKAKADPPIPVVDPYAVPAVADPKAKPGDPKAKPDPNLKPADPYAAPKLDKDAPPAIPMRVGLSDLPAVQGLLAVQRLDGWLLYDRDGSNPIAVRLVKPDGRPQRPWFYLIPAKGDPTALMHTSEARNFEHLAGKKLTYVGYRDLDKQMRAMIKGVKSIAIEYSPKAAVPNVSRVDAGTVENIRAAGVQVRSSETLVQYTKAIWGDAGRTAHYVAVHHVVELRKEALAFVAKRLRAREPVSEYDVQQRLQHNMTMRGLAGPPPVVAAGVNSADPYYVPTAAKTSLIKPGDVIVIGIAAKVDKPDGIYAAQTWVAVADKAVSEQVAKAFEQASLARDQALVLITDRSRKRRPVKGAEVDQATRAFLKKAGVSTQVMHRTGHSIDNDLQGGGADLDDFEVKDTRIMTAGTGFTVGPGLYWAGQFGVRTEVSVYLSPTGPEVTTPAQDYVEPLLK